MLQLLKLKYEESRVQALSTFSTFPEPLLLARYPNACWQWSGESLAALVSNTDFTFRPVHLASSKDEAFGENIEQQAFDEHMCFMYR
eukprot:3704957-Pleurochrysis_carterae.AAC.1